MGKWLSHLRQYKNANIRNNILTPEREAQLNSLGMIWNALNFYWEKNYLAAAEFYMDNGHLRIPSDYRSKDGLGIGHWIANMRNSRGKTLTDEQYRRMVNRKETGLFHMPRIKHTEDNVTWQEIMSRGYAAYGLLENLALYRMSSSSMTGNKMKAARDQWDTYRKYYKFSLVKSAYFFCWYAFNAIKRKLF